jgi:hypothetical protein
VLLHICSASRHMHVLVYCCYSMCMGSSEPLLPAVSLGHCVVYLTRR